MNTISSGSKTEKLIVFKVAYHLLALPIEDVLRIVNCPPQTSHELNEMGMVHFGKVVIRLLDLYAQLGTPEQSQVVKHPSFLVIIRGLQEELWGIPVQEPPNLIEVSRDLLRPLPNVGSQNRILKLASHTAVLSDQAVPTTLFLLDRKQAVSTAYV